MKAEVSSFRMTQNEEKEIHSLIDGEDISSQNLPHFLPDKMAKKAFILIAGLCFAFMAASAMILTTSPDAPGTKTKAFIDDGNYSK
jgi:hypothetical protein